jgi:hypothetical protein
MSAIGGKADNTQACGYVCFCPIADIPTALRISAFGGKADITLTCRDIRL